MYRLKLQFVKNMKIKNSQIVLHTVIQNGGCTPKESTAALQKLQRTMNFLNKAK